MALWLVRAGKYGEHEPRFFEDNRIYLTWAGLETTNLSGAATYDDIKALMQQHFSAEPNRRVGNWSGQVWAFTLAMQPGDYVVVPRKSNGTVAIGEVKSGYTFNPDAEGKYGHFRDVRWINTDVPRSAFDQDLLYSLGAIMTICQIQRNDAEKRIKALVNGQAPARLTETAVVTQPDAFGEAAAEIDLEQLSRDAIAKLIIQKFMGHGMARLVDAILKAQGFTTHLSPEGPDKGIDILAAGGPFGFDHPRICVQVKSGNTPADRPEFTQLIGAMQSVNADQGLFVSWSGFKTTVLKEVPVQFFKVRLWNQEDLIAQLLANYSKLDEDIRLELPLKQIWTLSNADD
jgi:restriction system protein